MRKIFISICIIIEIITTLKAQESLPSNTALYAHQIETSVFDKDYLQLSDLLTLDNWFIKQPNNIYYYKLISDIYNSNKDKEVLISSFLEEYPNAFNRATLKLWLGLIAMDNKDYPKALFYFEQIDDKGLNKDNTSCLDVAYALALSQRYYKDIPNKQTEKNREVNKLLDNAININGKYSERALFYMALVKWLEQDKQTAYNILKNTHWSPNLEDEAKYWSTLMMFDITSKQEALNNAISYLQSNPNRRNNIELFQSIGISYYILKDYPNAIKYLSKVYQAKLEDSKNIVLYVYGYSLYQQKEYNEAASILRLIVNKSYNNTTHRISPVESEAQLLLANSYIKLDKFNEAISVYSTLLSRIDIVKGNTLAEKAMYNSIILQNKIGSSNFSEEVRLSLEFINTFTDSNKREYIANILSQMLFNSKDYKKSLEYINSIKYPSEEIKKAKQYILLRLASITDEEDIKKEYLLKAIDLSNISQYYTDALTELALLYLKDGKYKEAETYSTEAINSSSSNNIAYYIKAYSLFNQKRYPEAYKLFGIFIDQDNKDNSYIEDSYIRMGDCMYQNQVDLKRAKDLYLKADSINSQGSDKALMRLLNIYAIQGKFNKEISIIDKILSRTTDKSIEPYLLYNKGRAIILNKDNPEKAIEVFEDLIKKYPNTQYSRLAMLNTAMTYYNENQDDKAIQIYKELINSDPSSDEASQGISDLKSIYMKADKLDEYIKYIKSLGKGFSLDANDESKLLFIQAENLYRKDSDKAISSLEKYISSYPNSIYINRAKSYLADLYYSDGDLNKAMTIYKDIENSDIEESIKVQAIRRLADMYYAKTDYKNAYQEYKKLYDNTTIPANDKSGIIIPMLRSIYLLKEYKLFTDIEDKVDFSSLSQEQKDEVLLLKSKNLVALSHKKEAVNVLKSINKDIDTEIGAESYILQTKLLFELGNTKKAKQDILSFIKQGTTKEYWLARAFILLSDIYYKEGDKYTARQYLESLKSNYKDADKDIRNMIDSRLNKLQVAK